MSYLVNTASLIGGVYLIVMFIVCFLTVCTIKIVVLYFKDDTPIVNPIENEPKKIEPKKQRREIKTITLDPEDINRIQFKKLN